MAGNDPLIGKLLGDYKIISAIGQGGMARIYKGYDDKLERYAAVKIFDARGIAPDELDEYRQRFMREARAIARLRHPQIVNVYQSGQFEDQLYMAMMFIEGRDLRYLLKDHAARETYLSREEILRIISDIATALDYAHREGVIHRDVKPSNIMITADGHAILTDFGLALNVPEGTIGTTFGSVHYIAPEQATSSALAVPQSDLYSLGVVLYEMLAGRVPFDDASAMSVALKHITEPPPPLHTYNPAVPPAVEAMVMQAMDKDPQKRYQTGAAFIQALEQALGMTDEDEMTRLLAPGGWPQNAPAAAAAAASKPPLPPAPVYAMSDEKTVSDPSRGARPSLAVPPPPEFPRRNLILAVILLVVGVGIVIGALLLAGDGLPGVVAVVASDTPTPSETPVPPTITPTVVTPTTAPPSPTTEPTDEATAEVAVPLSETPPAITDTPSETPSETSIPPTFTATASSGAVRLIYDAQSLVLFNQSDEDVNVSGLTFVQTRADSSRLTFLSDRWAGGSRAPFELPAGDCFQIWTFNDSLLEKPDYCVVRHAWRQASTIREFWISDNPGQVFTVERGGTVLAECRIDAGECVFDVG